MREKNQMLWTIAFFIFAAAIVVAAVALALWLCVYMSEFSVAKMKRTHTAKQQKKI